jgi:DNA-binding beta-propeller fold protein YncE
LKRYRSAAAVLLLVFTSSLVRAAGKLPLVEIGKTPLPDITGGDFDHFAVDLGHKRLYVVTEVYGSIEVFNLETGEHLKSARGIVKSPRKIIFLPDKNQLIVADAGNASCVFLDATELRVLNTVPLEPAPDAGVYSSKTRIFYVGNGGRGSKATFSYVSLIPVDNPRVTTRIRIEASTLKTLLLNEETDKLFVSMRDKSQVGVIDLDRKLVTQTWAFPELHQDSAMAYDATHQRLFVGDRAPGKLVVLDARNGRMVDTLNIGDVSDDMTYDAEHHRIYISSADGVDVVAQDSPDHYRVIQHIDTLGGKTSTYVPSLERFFVVHTKGGPAAQAGLQIFQVN